MARLAIVYVAWACAAAPDHAADATEHVIASNAKPSLRVDVDLDTLQVLARTDSALACGRAASCDLGAVHSARLHDAHGVVVSDGTRVFVVAADGVSTAIGRVGSGPAEYRVVADMRAHDDGIELFDVGRQRILSYDWNARLRAERAVSVSPGLLEFSVAARSLVAVVSLRDSTMGGRTRVQLTRTTGGAAGTEDIASFTQATASSDGAASGLGAIDLVGARFRVAACDDGAVILAHTDDASVFVVVNDDVREVALPSLRRRPLHAAQRDSIEDAIAGRARQYSGGQLAPGFLASVQRALERLPATMPPIARVWCAGGGAFVAELDIERTDAERVLLFFERGRAAVGLVPVGHFMFDVHQNVALLGHADRPELFLSRFQWQ